MDRFLGAPAPLIYYSGELARSDSEWPPLPPRKDEQSDEAVHPPKSRSISPPRGPTPPLLLDHDLLVLKELQKQFDDEDSYLRNERAALATVQPLMFTCAVCTDEYPEDFVARVPDCDHGFCRDCLKTYAVSKLKEHRFPIMCPSCVADGTGKQPGSKSCLSLSFAPS